MPRIWEPTFKVSRTPPRIPSTGSTRREYDAIVFVNLIDKLGLIELRNVLKVDDVPVITYEPYQVIINT